MFERILILDNVRSVHNVGSIFRTADAAGISTIYLAGYTPGPTDRFGRVRKDFAKASLGAEKTISYTHFNTLAEAIEKARECGHRVFAVEQTQGSTSLFDFPTPNTPYTLILGNEVTGIAEDDLALCDTVLEIPMFGKKESLNVSVAAGVAIFLLLSPMHGKDRFFSHTIDIS